MVKMTSWFEGLHPVVEYPAEWRRTLVEPPEDGEVTWFDDRSVMVARA